MTTYTSDEIYKMVCELALDNTRVPIIKHTTTADRLKWLEDPSHMFVGYTSNEECIPHPQWIISQVDGEPANMKSHEFIPEIARIGIPSQMRREYTYSYNYHTHEMRKLACVFKVMMELPLDAIVDGHQLFRPCIPVDTDTFYVTNYHYLGMDSGTYVFERSYDNSAFEDAISGNNPNYPKTVTLQFQSIGYWMAYNMAKCAGDRLTARRYINYHHSFVEFTDLPKPANYKEEDFVEQRYPLLMEGLDIFFNTNKYAHSILMSTAGKKIVYYNPKDAIYGSGEDGKGDNMLGVALMATRAIYEQYALQKSIDV